MTNEEIARGALRAGHRLVMLGERPRFDDAMWWTALLEAIELADAVRDGLLPQTAHDPAHEEAP